MNIDAIISLLVVNAVFNAAPGVAEMVTSPPVIINETNSMQKGLYVRKGDAVDPKHGDIIAVPMGQSAQHYLREKLGYPAQILLIKRVAALPGETVCRAEGMVVLPDRTVSFHTHDSKGNVLPFWEGCYTLSPDEVFLLGDHPSSFDSRYFGPVHIDDLVGTYQQVVSW